MCFNYYTSEFKLQMYKIKMTLQNIFYQQCGASPSNFVGFRHNILAVGCVMEIVNKIIQYMKKNRCLPFFALLAVMSTSCSIYHPQAVDIPLISHAGDTRVDASVALSTWLLPDVMTLNATVSHGFNDWLAGQVHLNYGGENYYGQAAPGAYLPLGEHGLLEGYVGMGFGGAWRDQAEQVSDSVSSRTYSYSGRFTVPFGQVNIGWHDLTGAHIDLALGIKAGAYNPNFQYREYDSNGTLVPEDCYTYNVPSFLFEPQLVFRIGGEHVKFCLRGSYAWLSDIEGNVTSGTSHNFTSDLFTLSAGLNFTF